MQYGRLHFSAPPTVYRGGNGGGNIGVVPYMPDYPGSFNQPANSPVGNILRANFSQLSGGSPPFVYTPPRPAYHFLSQSNSPDSFSSPSSGFSGISPIPFPSGGYSSYGGVPSQVLPFLGTPTASSIPPPGWPFQQ
ncbi:unnamed protein product [Didymodactylos carnosus]|uniref:Uncharacterized protein n=1 Tax=Didymodactylos carnosus TaxID=1234261 RepID=A0A815JNW0_9BILA|nr:unnamed protein product [Didymodactylos carnosus]CAF1384745.1 unnamed protein product [Didymodactylos carnosus]CAF3673937.1 unnamed protein product [Didymodactylos carnosus]CAF4279914.1 unnamed protein product [Didymodactylos carnosus]